MRSVIISAIALASVHLPLSAQTIPADPIKHLDGIWFGEDRVVMISVENGVATVDVNTSADKYVQSLQMTPGTIIARLNGYTVDGKRLVRLHGQCWTGGSRPQLGNCGDFNSVLDLSMEGNKQINRLKINTLQFRRKADFAKGSWEYRK